VELLCLLHLYLIEVSKYKNSAEKNRKRRSARSAEVLERLKSARGALAREFLTYINYSSTLIIRNKRQYLIGRHLLFFLTKGSPNFYFQESPFGNNNINDERR
jgi:hypothetical protein